MGIATGTAIFIMNAIISMTEQNPTTMLQTCVMRTHYYFLQNGLWPNGGVYTYNYLNKNLKFECKILINYPIHGEQHSSSYSSSEFTTTKRLIMADTLHKHYKINSSEIPT